ncbi:MAG: histidine phosphatase family protein [Patescibacteria group bacterium]|nr:histidine phosphatase family protein [Patescibacteria group bacterium]MDD4304054.1 histidine phosphatase family protein [Patescibacteria group bacterium]MDD4694931.1 histidine phosphatase family protein [Patescibacteria group bacterium]
MSVNITYFVHGTTIDNEKDLASGWCDTDLSELGVKQSIELKECIKNKKFDVVFCSDLIRAVHSAELTFKNIEIIKDKRLRECNYGYFTRKKSSEFKNRLNNFIENPFPNGESYYDVENRVRELVKYLKDNYNNKNIAIVCHQAPQLALDVILKNMTWLEAIDNDWRITHSWQPGWEYVIE